MSVADTRRTIDPAALQILDSEYDHTFVGGKLLSVANYCRHAGIGEDDIEDLIRSSQLWVSFEDSTSMAERNRDKLLDSAIQKSRRSGEFELSDALEEMWEKANRAEFTGRNGSRDRAVLLAFIGFCWEHNCFTRTISTYELATYTNGIGPKPVGKALTALTEEYGKPLREVERRDNPSGRRPARRYRLNLEWTPPGGPTNIVRQRPNEIRKNTLGPTRPIFGEDVHEDVWTRGGLGETSRRVYDFLDSAPDGWFTFQELAEHTGMSKDMAKRATVKLFDYGLAARRSRNRNSRGKPPFEYQRAVDIDMEKLADYLGVSGVVERRVYGIRLRQDYYQNRGWRKPIEVDASGRADFAELSFATNSGNPPF